MIFFCFIKHVTTVRPLDLLSKMFTGKVFAMMSVADTTVPLFSGIIYSQVYNATIDTYPAAIYWVTVTSQLVVFISAL